MSLFPIGYLPHLITITPFSLESVGATFNNNGNIVLNAAASAVWPTANLGLFVPFTVYFPITIVKMFTMNGATATGNIDVGIYSTDGTKIVSMGSTAMAGTNALQSFDITDTQLGAGTYYMAMSCSSASATFFRVSVSSGTRPKFTGMAQAASQLPLANNPTFATVANDYIPVFGLTTRTVI